MICLAYQVCTVGSLIIQSSIVSQTDFAPPPTTHTTQSIPPLISPRKCMTKNRSKKCGGLSVLFLDKIFEIIINFFFLFSSSWFQLQQNHRSTLESVVLLLRLTKFHFKVICFRFLHLYLEINTQVNKIIKSCSFWFFFVW